VGTKKIDKVKIKKRDIRRLKKRGYDLFMTIMLALKGLIV